MQRTMQGGAAETDAGRTDAGRTDAGRTDARHPSIALSPDEVEAGGAVEIVAHLPGVAEAAGVGADERAPVRIVDAAGAEAGSIALQEDSDGGLSGRVCLHAPRAPGAHVWMAVPAGGAAVPLPFTVRPHAVTVTVWDVPATVDRGARFAVRAGVKCAAGCYAGGWRIVVRDGSGRVAGAAPAGPVPRPGTEALHWASIDLVAPDRDGAHAWTVTAEPVAEPRHDPPTAAALRLRVVPAPEYTLSVTARDRATGAPVEGARVVLHPYRGHTGADGRAEIPVAGGSYVLFVSGRGHVPFRVEGEMTRDMELVAELDADAEITEAEIWA